MIEEKPLDVEMVTPMAFPRVGKKHVWFGGPELAGYAAFIFLAALTYTAARPGLLPAIATHFAVLKDIEARNAVELPNGVVSLDLYRYKMRNGKPLSVVFYIVNALTAEGDKGIRVLPYHGDADCKKIDEGGGDTMFTHKIGVIITHFCMKLPQQVTPGQDYSIRGEMNHSAWPFYSIVPVTKAIPEFTPARSNAHLAPRGRFTDER